MQKPGGISLPTKISGKQEQFTEYKLRVPR